MKTISCNNVNDNKPKGIFDLEKRLIFSYILSDVGFMAKWICRVNSLTIVHEYFHRADFEWSNRAGFYFQQGKQCRWLCFLLLLLKEAIWNFVLLLDSNDRNSLVLDYLNDNYDLNSIDLIRHMSERWQEDIYGRLPHTGSLAVVCFWGQVSPEQANSTSLTEKHKEAVLLWVCRRVTGTGSVTREESTKWSQEIIKEHFLGGFNSIAGLE